MLTAAGVTVISYAPSTSAGIGPSVSRIDPGSAPAVAATTDGGASDTEVPITSANIRPIRSSSSVAGVTRITVAGVTTNGPSPPSVIAAGNGTIACAGGAAG